jgi:hypothetical protein
MSAFGGKADMAIALEMSAFDPKRKPTWVVAPPQEFAPSGLAPKAKRADSNRPAFSDPRTSEEVVANDYQWSCEKMVTANPQGGKKCRAIVESS